MKRLLFILALVCAPTYAQTNTARMLSGTNVVTSCPYTVQATDTTKLLIFKSTSACAVTLPAATTANFGTGALFSVINQGAGTATITPATGTIGGNVNLALVTGQGADIYSDGANYQVQPGSGTGGGGGGSPPAGSNGDTQCKNALLFAACVQQPAILYVSTSGNDTNSGKTWDTSKLTIMAAVCALPGGNCSTTPKQAGTGTVYFTSGVFCNSNANAGCWLAGSGDSQYPNMTGSISGPSAWTIDDVHGDESLNFICATKDTGTTNISKPFCIVEGPNHTVGGGYLPMFWATGNSLGSFYIDGLSTGQFAGGVYSAAWGRIGIDSATGQITGTPTVTQTVGWTIENVYSGNDTGGGTTGPQLAIGNGFWMHLHDSGFGPAVPEGCTVSGASRTSNVVTITTSNCSQGAAPTQCPFLNGDHLSIRDTTGDGTFNGTFTAASSCSGNTVTFNQTGPNFSGSVGSSGIIVDDRAFGIVCYSCQIEMARMHNSGGLKFYSGPSSNLQFNDNYIEGTGAQNTPLVWISSLIYGGGGLVDISGQFMSDTPLLPSMINDGGPQVFVHTEASQSTNIRGPAIVLNGNDAVNRTTGLIASGQSGWYDNTHLEASTDIARRQAAVTSRIFTNFAPQNPASWTGSSFTTTSGKRDPFGGTGAVEIDATALTSAFIYNVTQSVNVGDTWYFGGWVRAVNGTFSSANTPFAFYLGSGNLCVTNTSQPLGVSTPFLGDGNWFWATGSCTVWSTAGSAAVGLAVGLNSSTPVQVYRPFVMVVSAALGVSNTEVADEINSLGFGPSTQAGAGDIVYPADKKLCLSSGSATNEFCSYLTHANTANRNNTIPDLGGNYVTLSSGNEVSALTGQTCVSTNGSACAFSSPGILDGNSGSAVTSTPYAVQCDSGTALIDRAHLLRFQSGASVVTVPLSSASGCTGGFVFTAVDESAGSLTFNRTSADTFSIYDGAAATTGATSFRLSNGQYATLSQGATGIWEVRISSAVNTINAANPAYGMYWDAQQVHDATFTISSGAVSSTNATFKASDVGKVAYGWSFCQTGGATAGQTINIAQTTITGFTDSHHITVGANAAANATNACFTWGHIDDTGLNAVEAAAAALGTCPQIIMPAASALLGTSHFIQALPSCTNTGPGLGGSVDGWGEVIRGAGKGATVLHIIPNFTISSCTGGPSTGACFGGQQGQYFVDFTINGDGQNRNGSCDHKTPLELASYSRINGVGLYDWGQQELQSCFHNFFDPTGTIHVENTEFDGFGSGIEQDTAGTVYISHSGIGDFCMTGSNPVGYYLNGTGRVKSTQNGWFGGAASCLAANQQLFLINNASGVLYTTQDQWFAQGNARLLGAIINVAGGRIYATGSEWDFGEAAGGVPVVSNVAGGIIYAQDNLWGAGSGDPIISGGTIFDRGGNEWLGANGYMLASFLYSANGVHGTCTGTATSSSTLGLYGTGPNVTTTTCTTTTIGGGISVSGSRTVNSLTVNASHAGVNASSGVVTVLKNGVATALTCTLGTGAYCSDNTHGVSAVDGDLISIQFTTQASEVLAGVSASVTWW